MLLLFFFPLVLTKTYIITTRVSNKLNINALNTVAIGDLAYTFHQSDFPPTVVDALWVEEDLPMYSQQCYSMQKTPTWGLDKTDSSSLDSRYFYNSNAGKNTTNYILDTGIYIKNTEFEGRAIWGANFADKESSDGCMASHGTHVAGIIGSKTYGVAKKTVLVSVKVLGCDGSGSTSSVIKGIQWVIQHSASKKVINMSLGGGFSNALNSAVSSAVSAGIVVVTAAGNENSDACKTSPASNPSSITVGAYGVDNKFASFSNWGACVDIIAPGVDILSTVLNDKTEKMSGTSMGAPFVAGVVSLLLATVKPEDMQEYVKKISIKNKITGNLNNSPNNMLISI